MSTRGIPPPQGPEWIQLSMDVMQLIRTETANVIEKFKTMEKGTRVHEAWKESMKSRMVELGEFYEVHKEEDEQAVMCDIQRMKLRAALNVPRTTSKGSSTMEDRSRRRLEPPENAMVKEETGKPAENEPGQEAPPSRKEHGRPLRMASLGPLPGSRTIASGDASVPLTQEPITEFDVILTQDEYDELQARRMAYAKMLLMPEQSNFLHRGEGVQAHSGSHSVPEAKKDKRLYVTTKGPFVGHNWQLREEGRERRARRKGKSQEWDSPERPPFRTTFRSTRKGAIDDQVEIGGLPTFGT